MSESQQSNTGWQPCRPGEIHRMAQNNRRKRRHRRVMVLSGSGLVAGALLLALVAVFQTSEREAYFGGLSCTQVRSLAAEYMAGGLRDELRRKVAIHLEHCPECSRLIRQMQQKRVPSEAKSTPADQSRRLALAWLGPIPSQ